MYNLTEMLYNMKKITSASPLRNLNFTHSQSFFLSNWSIIDRSSNQNLNFTETELFLNLTDYFLNKPKYYILIPIGTPVNRL